MRKLSAAKLAAMRGAAAVELAILLPFVMLPLAFGAVEYGRAYFYYNTLAKAVRDGARLLSQNSPDDVTYANKMVEARCLVVHGNPGCTGPTLAPGLTTADVVICDRLHLDDCTGEFEVTAPVMGTVRLVEVKILNYQFNYLGLPTYIPLGKFATSVIFGEELPNPGIRAVMRQIV
ncbi:TadE/TadG family type IV pilus assembly protein [Noviherbaspirillum saxi]|nr:TadE/TadG family type IV pilus assembly protein [Noviherbaspirillum saxi]